MSAFTDWTDSDAGPDLSVFGSLEKYWLHEAWNAALDAAAKVCEERSDLFYAEYNAKREKPSSIHLCMSAMAGDCGRAILSLKDSQ